MSGNVGGTGAIEPTGPQPAKPGTEMAAGFSETRVGRLVWFGIGLIALLLFIARFIGGWWFEKWEGLHICLLFLACGLLLYGSFLIEGIILVASKVEEYDEEAMDRAMRDRYGPADNIRATLIYVKRKIDPILIGQPLVAISITLLFDSIVEMAGLHLDPKGVPVATNAQTLPQWTIWLLSSSLISGALSAALVYWVGQLLQAQRDRVHASSFGGPGGEDAGAALSPWHRHAGEDCGTVASSVLSQADRVAGRRQENLRIPGGRFRLFR